jgi:hypothetical protein
VYTDDRGEYRFGWIPAGSAYYVTVTGEPWYLRRSIPGLDSTEPVQAYAPTYYPNVSDASRAAPLKIAAGEEVHADFTLRTVVGSKITLKTTLPAGSKGMTSLMYSGVAGNDAFQRQATLAPGMQVLTGVPPGSYTLRVTVSGGSAGDLIGYRHIDVNGTDIMPRAGLCRVDLQLLYLGAVQRLTPLTCTA